MFNSHFIMNRPVEKIISYLYMVKQKLVETLREYLSWFHKPSLEIPKLNDEVAVEYVKQGLNPASSFFVLISKIKYLTLQQVRKKAEKYIRQEETKISRKEDDYKNGSTIDDHGRRRDKGPSRDRANYDLDSNHYQGGKDRKKMTYTLYNDFTALKKPFHEVFLEVRNIGFIPTFLEIKPNPRREESKDYCRFHRAKDHDTKICW